MRFLPSRVLHGAAYDSTHLSPQRLGFLIPPALSVSSCPSSREGGGKRRKGRGGPMVRSSVTAGFSSTAAAATEVVARLKKPELLRGQALIGGKWVGSSSGSSFDVLNPATEELVGQVPCMGREDAAAAVQAASDAWEAGWKRSTTKQRENVLKKWAALCKEHIDDLATIMTLESGKPFAESKGEVLYGLSFLEFYAEETKRINGMVIPSPTQTQRLSTIKQPIGVCSLLTPFNFPMAMITRKAGPALAAGCTAVIKPAEDTPLSALAVCYLAEKAGVPKGVLNVVTTNREGVKAVGEELCTNPVVRKVSFTGSTAVGKILLRHASGTVKKVSMELGGNAPFIVFGDADVDKAVEGAVASKFRFSGQTCVCSNRFLVHSSVYDDFSRKLVDKVKAFKLGNPLERNITHGPLITLAAAQRVNGVVKEAEARGATVLTGGGGDAQLPGGGGLGSDRFVEPMVLGDCTANMRVCRDEIFGPIAPLVRFESEEEAVAIANSADTGLAGYFYTRDYARIIRVSEALEVGMVGVNEGIISKEVIPFGGVKQSGLGREGSVVGIEEYLETKYVCIGGL